MPDTGTWLYRQTEPTLWTVGHYWHDGTRDQWEPESDHGTAEAAAARVRHLNGGPAPAPDRAAAHAAAERLVLGWLSAEHDAGAVLVQGGQPTPTARLIDHIADALVATAA